MNTKKKRNIKEIKEKNNKMISKYIQEIKD